MREVQESFPQKKRPAYTTVQTIMYRLEAKGALRRAKEDKQCSHLRTTLSREVTQGRLSMICRRSCGAVQAGHAHALESVKLMLEDIKNAEKMILFDRGQRVAQTSAALVNHLW